jgi:hypothetical protein
MIESRTEKTTKELLTDVDNIKIFLENSPWNFRHQRFLVTLLEELEA